MYPGVDEIEAFLARVQQESPALIILYGSLARGDFTQHSDIDVLCIFDRQFDTMKQRFMITYKHSDGTVQPKTLSLVEFKSGLVNGDPFLHRVVHEGILLKSTIPLSVINEWIESGRDNMKFTYYPPFNS